MTQIARLKKRVASQARKYPKTKVKESREESITLLDPKKNMEVGPWGGCHFPNVETRAFNWCCGLTEATFMAQYGNGIIPINASWVEDAVAGLVKGHIATNSLLVFTDNRTFRGEIKNFPVKLFTMWLEQYVPECIRRIAYGNNSNHNHMVDMWIVDTGILRKIVKVVAPPKEKA